MNSSHRRGTAGAGAAMFFVGTLTAVSATISGYPVFGGQAVRYAVAALVLLAVARFTGRPPAGRPRGTGSCWRPWRRPAWSRSTCASWRPPRTPARPRSAR
ncbi:hypothetical protein LUX33_18675 [Actinomadura madurae]|uniref:hypothetical protein n=1 Tax=Actinomadura madurae TaxID=1993 RepID=UPI0020D25C1B|nr:hypothetical protein [Actinomadura madurae]MCP9950238.1 hypothetical protein [Actinomadura madurae]